MRFDHILIAYYFSIYRLRTLPLTGRMLCPPTVRIYFSAYKLFAATPLSGYPELLAHAYWGGAYCPRFPGHIYPRAGKLCASPLVFSCTCVGLVNSPTFGIGPIHVQGIFKQIFTAGEILDEGHSSGGIYKGQER